MKISLHLDVKTLDGKYLSVTNTLLNSGKAANKAFFNMLFALVGRCYEKQIKRYNELKFHEDELQSFVYWTEKQVIKTNLLIVEYKYCKTE